MEEELTEFNHCEHLQDLVNYCNLCKLFVCEDCSVDHLEHLEEIVEWSNLIKEYLIRCNNCEHRIRVLLKIASGENIDQGPTPEQIAKKKKEIDSKIDALFTELYKKFDIYKQNIKDEIFNKFMEKVNENKTPTKNADSEHLEADIDELKDLLKKVEGVVKDMVAFEKKDDKESMIKILQKNVIKEVEGRVHMVDVDIVDVEHHLHDTPHAPKLPQFDFSISDCFNLDLFLRGLKITPPLREEGKSSGRFSGPKVIDQTENFCFPKGRRIWRKPGKIKEDLSICCSMHLPQYFKIRIRINNFTHHQFGVFGICKKDFKSQEEAIIGWEKDQWGFTEDGKFIHHYKGKGYGKSGNDIKGKKGDVVTLVYDNTHKLSFSLNGVKQPKCFRKLPGGPFYICCSLTYVDSEIEIIEVSKLVYSSN